MEIKGLLEEDNWLLCPHCGGTGIRPVSFNVLEIGFRCEDCHAGPPDEMYQDYVLLIQEIDGCTQLSWKKK